MTCVNHSTGTYSPGTLKVVKSVDVTGMEQSEELECATSWTDSVPVRQLSEEQQIVESARSVGMDSMASL